MKQREYETHAMWDQVDEVRALFTNAPVAPSPEAKGHLDTIGAFTSYLAGFRYVDVLLIPQNYFNQVANVVKNIHNQSKTLAVKNVAWANIKAAAAQVPTGMQALNLFPQPLTSDDAATQREAAHRARLEAELEAYKRQVDDATKAVTKVNGQLSALTASFDKPLRQVSGQIDEQRTEYENDRRSRTDAFEKEVAARSAAYDEELRSARERSDELIQSLEAKDAESTALLDTTGRNVVSGEYGNWATRQDKLATRWTIGAIVIGLVAAGALYWAFVWTETSGVSDSIQRTAISALALVVAGYAGRQASEHRREERVARRIQLDLAALDPFLRHLEDPSALREEVARRIFASENTQDETKRTFSLSRRPELSVADIAALIGIKNEQK